MADKITTTDRPGMGTSERPAAAALDAEPGAAISRPLRIAITAFVLFNLFAIVSFCVPMDSPLIAECRDLSLPYLRWTGLFQKWDMFAPDPSKLNNYIGAMVVHRNGSISFWTFPRMENLGVFEKYVKERYRKYSSDNLRLDSNSPLWPDAARYIARVDNQPSNPPATVALVRYWSIVPPPGANGPSPWNQYIFFRYNIAPGDLP